MKTYCDISTSENTSIDDTCVEEKREHGKDEVCGKVYRKPNEKHIWKGKFELVMQLA